MLIYLFKLREFFSLFCSLVKINIFNIFSRTCVLHAPFVIYFAVFLWGRIKCGIFFSFAIKKIKYRDHFATDSYHVESQVLFPLYLKLCTFNISLFELNPIFSSISSKLVYTFNFLLWKQCVKTKNFIEKLQSCCSFSCWYKQGLQPLKLGVDTRLPIEQVNLWSNITSLNLIKRMSSNIYRRVCMRARERGAS